jgi:hypothetical protein
LFFPPRLDLLRALYVSSSRAGPKALICLPSIIVTVSCYHSCSIGIGWVGFRTLTVLYTTYCSLQYSTESQHRMVLRSRTAGQYSMYATVLYTAQY